MKKAVVILLLLVIPAGLFAREKRKASPADSLECAAGLAMTNPDSLAKYATPEFLDTVNVKKSKVINDYDMIGVNYGVTFSTMSFNPSKHNKDMVFTPQHIAIMYTHYSKMFGYIQNFGLTMGLEYGHEGFSFKKDEETNLISHVDSATFCRIQLIDIPVMAQIHVDFEPVKIMIDLGIYGGYRHSIYREGFLKKPYQTKFRDYENRWDYGLKGGLGFALMFDPVEIHFNAHLRWSWESLYQADYYSPYYYRFAYPLDIMVTAGVHFQLTKRHGRTTSSLKREAKNIVYGKPIEEKRKLPGADIGSQDR